MDEFEYLFYQLIVYFASFPLILGLVLFFFSRIKRKTKIITFLIILPFLLRVIFGLYFFPPPLGFLLKIQSKILTRIAVETKNSGVCLSIGELVPFFALIPPSRAKFTSAPLQEDCVIAVAVAEKNESLCNVLMSNRMAYHPYSSTYKNNCYTEVAKIKEDFSICERLEEGVAPSEAVCYQRVFLALEKYKDILAECKKFPEEYYPDEKINECIKNIAIETKNIELCKGLNWEGMAAECKKEILIASDILAPCKDLLTTKRKNECIKDIAIERDDIDLCSLLPFSERGIMGECYKEIVYSGRRTDVELCKKQFPDADRLPQRACLFEVAVNKNDISICKKGGSYDSTAWCYTGIAIKRNDPKICYEMIRDYTSVPEEDCFMDLALKTDNLEICKELKAEYQREGCISRIAIQRDDEKLCETLSRSDSKRSCLTGIAIKRGDLEMCKRIAGSYGAVSYKDNCIKEIAIAKNDPKICDYIEKKHSQYLCYKEFGIK